MLVAHLHCGLPLSRQVRPSMPSIDDVVLTVAALDAPSFGHVARGMHVSQSTVSRAVQRVEAEVGPLLLRDARSVRPLPDAGETIASLRRIAATWRQLTSSTDEAHTKPVLSVYCTVTASQTIAPELLIRFRAQHPHVGLEIRTGPASGALDAAKRGEVDVAIAPLPATVPKSLATIRVHTTSFVAIASSPTEWDNRRVIVPRSGLTRALVDRWCRDSLQPGWQVQETDTHEEAVAMAAVGSGIALVPRLVLDASPQRQHLTVLRPPLPLPLLDIGLCALRRTISRTPLSLLWNLNV